MPESIDEKLDRLAKKAGAISGEYDLASKVHETWKPMISDQQLHNRIGKSYSANTFVVIRDALRRDMVMALMRIWDNGDDTLSLFALLQEIDVPDVMDALVARRSERLVKAGIPGIEQQVREQLSGQREKLRVMIAEYGAGGASADTLGYLRDVRNTRLAHNLSTKRKKKGSLKRLPEDKGIEQFYLHTSGIVKGVLHLLAGNAYEPDEAAAIYRDYAAYFWEGVKGEQTEGHPHMVRTAATRAWLVEQGFLPKKVELPQGGDVAE